MRLYSGMSEHFIRDTVQNQIAGKLEQAFFRHFPYRRAQSEVRAWRKSLRALCQVFQVASLTDHGVVLEFQLPLTSGRLVAAGALDPIGHEEELPATGG